MHRDGGYFFNFSAVPLLTLHWSLLKLLSREFSKIFLAIFYGIPFNQKSEDAHQTVTIMLFLMLFVSKPSNNALW